MSSTARMPQKGLIISAALAVAAPGFVGLAWANPSDSANVVTLPSGARALRLAGVCDVNHVAGKTAGAGEQVSMSWTREQRLAIRGVEGQNGPAVAVLQGDALHVANAAGEFEPYLPGTGTTMVMGYSREKYTNTQSTPVTVVADLAPHWVVQAIEVRGFVRTITANNTKYIGNDGTELSADEVLFEAPFAGVLQGPLRVSIEPSGGVPAGQIDVTVRIKVPGGSWADAQINAAPWTVSLSPTGLVTSATDAALGKYGGTLSIPAGTKVGFEIVKNNAVANAAQLNARLAFA